MLLVRTYTSSNIFVLVELGYYVRYQYRYGTVPGGLPTAGFSEGKYNLVH